jgi:hypothetical protein
VEKILRGAAPEDPASPGALMDRTALNAFTTYTGEHGARDEERLRATVADAWPALTRLGLAGGSTSVRRRRSG